jgi:hypothetical protein
MLRFSRRSQDKQLPQSRRAHGTAVRDRSVGADEQSFTFRRNQTLTGSSSSKIGSLNEANAHITSPRVQVHTLASHRRRLGASFVIVLGVAVVLFVLVQQFTAQVLVTASPDPTLQLDSSYQQTVQQYLTAQPFERFRFALNSSHLQSYIKAINPEVRTISVDGSAGFGTSRFIISLRQPIVGWSINGHQQYVDSTGVAFNKNYYPSPAVQVVDNSGIQVTQGQAVASNRFLGFVGQVVGLARTQHLMPTKVVIPTGTTRQIELQLQGLPYVVKFSIDRPAGEQVEDMVRSVKWFQSHGISPQYIDVRVSGRAFYQ